MTPKQLLIINIHKSNLASVVTMELHQIYSLTHLRHERLILKNPQG